MKATMRKVSAISWIAAVLVHRASVRSGSDTDLPSGLARPGLVEHNGSMSDHLGI